MAAENDFSFLSTSTSDSSAGPPAIPGGIQSAPVDPTGALGRSYVQHVMGPTGQPISGGTGMLHIPLGSVAKTTAPASAKLHILRAIAGDTSKSVPVRRFKDGTDEDYVARLAPTIERRKSIIASDPKWGCKVVLARSAIEGNEGHASSVG